MATGNQLWTLDDAEAENMAGAIQKVARHYDLPDVASETKDWLALLIVAGSIYGPRLAANWADKNTPPDAPVRDGENVVQINPAIQGLHS